MNKNNQEDKNKETENAQLNDTLGTEKYKHDKDPRVREVSKLIDEFAIRFIAMKYMKDKDERKKEKDLLRPMLEDIIQKYKLYKMDDKSYGFKAKYRVFKLKAILLTL